MESIGGGRGINVGSLNPFTLEQTSQHGLIFQHYAYVLEKQLDFET